MNSGIYKIANITTGDFYVGSAVNLHRRFNEHKNTLKNLKHKNPILQRVYNKYGVEKLSFEIIEYVEDKNNLISREQYYLDTLRPVYNICKEARSCLGVKRSKEFKRKLSEFNKGKKISEECKKKISESKKGFNPSKETRKKLSDAGKGNKNFLGHTHTEETKKKISRSVKRYYKSNKGD